jgi:hypothetical protein
VISNVFPFHEGSSASGSTTTFIRIARSSGREQSQVTSKHLASCR